MKFILPRIVVVYKCLSSRDFISKDLYPCLRHSILNAFQHNKEWSSSRTLIIKKLISSFFTLNCAYLFQTGLNPLFLITSVLRTISFVSFGLFVDINVTVTYGSTISLSPFYFFGIWVPLIIYRSIIISLNWCNSGEEDLRNSFFKTYPEVWPPFYSKRAWFKSWY